MNYDIVKRWWACSDLNREPKDYESSALTIELQARGGAETGTRTQNNALEVRYDIQFHHSSIL